MCKSPLHPFLTRLPKCEHHLHIEGSLSPDLLFALSAKNSTPLPPITSDPSFASPATLNARYAAFSSLDDFLAYYYIGMRVLVTPSDFSDLTYAYLARAAREGVRHAEVFFDPQAHLSRGVSIDTVVSGLLAGRRRAEAEFAGRGAKRLTVLFIPCLLRHLPVSDSAACFELMQSKGYFSRGDLAGLGLCSTELAKPPGDWAEIFAAAGRHGIRRTAHAGEEGPAGYVIAALDELGVSRIDHGVRAAEDEGVMERLAREGVMLTVCPMSNVRLKGVERIEHVPIRKFLERGVRFSINSDDPAYFEGYVQDNYCAVQEAFGLTVGEWRTIARNAVEGSWCGEERKREILGEIEEVCGRETGAALG
ncbi:adenosine deaminase [Coniochaeta ligniaria NRRL 30616]|uniref:Adenine deaminase n=1 Tax=Coniochaeta ligniaria NRRL 30616 TaxID=1408157 RepID=A0A1J7JJM0_9PEZI|nr:adenosine deaminase [Coniochaeta ligniaria NRRL 30616]